MRSAMIEVTRLNDKGLMVNCELIQFIEETPDTVITFTDGKKIVVKETKEELVSKVIAYKRKIFEQAF